tara:strand:+ start:6413 stop:7447 length:1035 start_codon:yes stop_codon:yes gene_type:complete
MRLSLNSLIYIINFFLAGLAFYMIGAILSTWLHYHLISLPVLQISSYEYGIQKLPKDRGRKRESFDVILERNIFDAQQTEVEPPEINFEKEGEKVSKNEDLEVESSLLEIALAGTMIYGEQNSYAFISKKDSLQNYVIFEIGDCFDPKNITRDEICKDNSAQVLQIKDRWVLIIFQGERQTLRMRNISSVKVSKEDSLIEKKLQSQSLPFKKKSDNSPSKLKKALRKKAANNLDFSNDQNNTFHFKRVWVDEQLANFEQLLNDARVVPVKKGQSPHFMFQFIKDESIYEKLGLKKNDIILEINGFAVDSVAKALKLLEVLQSEREISLKVERDGNPVSFRYYIN